MKEQPFKVETKGAGFVINAPGMIVTAEKTGRVSLGIEAVASQLNRAHEAGKLEGKAEVAEAEQKLSETYKVQREGWRAIAEALIAIGMGYEMRGFGDNPPREILDDLLGTTETVTGPDTGKVETITTSPRADAQILESIRDSLVGRAWRVRGSQGAGTCDYPLCPNRAASRKPTGHVDVPIVSGIKLHVCGANVATIAGENGETAGSTKRELHECHRWAQWVEARARAGRIEVAR